MIEYDRLPVLPEGSDTVTVKEYVPIVVGIPDISPDEDNVNPGGSEPAVTTKL